MSWVANNTAKMGLQHPGNPARSCWTLFSTAPYGKKNKVPQENVPAAKAEQVTEEMLEAMGRAMGIEVGP